MNTVNWRSWGIETGYEDARERWQASPRASLLLVKESMTGRAAPADPTFRDVWVLEHGETRAITEPAELHLEDGTVEPAGSYLRRDLPLGYHELENVDTDE